MKRIPGVINLALCPLLAQHGEKNHILVFSCLSLLPPIEMTSGLKSNCNIS